MSIVFICIAALGTWFSFKRPNLLISLCTGLLWLALAMWIFFSTVPIIPLGEIYADILCWVFFIMVFVSFLGLMDTEIQMEKNGSKWSEWGAKPSNKETSYEKYKKELRKRRLG